MEIAFISIGSNLGDRVANCRTAVEFLKVSARVLASSSLYETAPWGKADQPDFINQVVEIETELNPLELLARIETIETRMGRVKTGERWGPSPIDLDIIFYGNKIMDCNTLTIPHPLMSERAFVLVPLAEISPGFVHPVLKKKVGELLTILDEHGEENRPKIISFEEA